MCSIIYIVEIIKTILCSRVGILLYSQLVHINGLLYLHITDIGKKVTIFNIHTYLTMPQRRIV